MKTLIEQKLKELKERRAQLDGEIKSAEQFMQQAIPEITGVQRAITELEAVLKMAEDPEKA